MKVTRETLHKMAHLARLEVDEADEPKLLEDLSEILTWVEKLNELNTDGVEPLSHMATEINHFREDKPINKMKREDGLSASPKHDEEFFQVPTVIKRKS